MSTKHTDTEGLISSAAGATLKRRTFMKAGVAAAGTGAAITSLPFKAMAKADSQPASPKETKEIWSSCMVNCLSRCPLKYHVEDGVIVRTETDNYGNDEYGEHQVRACLRGRSSRRRVYNPDRLKYPMKRVGKRGEGKFEKISWDEALDTIADNLKRIKKEYGNEAIYLNRATGLMGATLASSAPPATSQFAKLMNLWGGWLDHYGTYSNAQIRSAFPCTYGERIGNGITDVENTKLLVVFGHNPAETRASGGGIMYHLEQARKKQSVRMIVIDPRYSDTCLGKEDEWVPIRPGTDPALIAGMAHVMIKENLIDQPFLNKYCMGYDSKTLPEGAPENGDYKSYILGTGPDGVEKTPEWAEEITGVPRAKIVKIAREIAGAKPAFITQGWGPQRQANGEQNCRAIAMLSILTGNVGISGGNTGNTENSYSTGYPEFPIPPNPVKTMISVFTWMQAITDGVNMTATRDGVRGKDKLGVPLKFMWNYAGNVLVNQHSDINNTREVLADDTKCEMIVVIDNHMTTSARFADIILPDVTTPEREDIAIAANNGNMDYRIYCSQAIEPMFECKNIYQICTELSKRLGIEKEFTEGRNEREWLAHIHEMAGEKIPNLPSFDEFREQGIIKFPNPGAAPIAFKDFREDPEKHPLKTPSGKIEVYSQVLAECEANWELPEGDVITPLPQYVKSYRGHDHALAKEFPLQMIGYHIKSRTHSSYHNVDILQEAIPDKLWINPIDAEARGISHDQLVEVFNDKGRLTVQAKVTSRIMPGVTALPEGAWYKPDRQGVDRGSCINTVTHYDRPSPYAKGNPQHTNLVEVKVWKKERNPWLSNMAFMLTRQNALAVIPVESPARISTIWSWGVNHRRVYEYEGGNWVKKDNGWHPDVFSYYVSVSCNHCEQPACTSACPTGAMHKREEDGLIAVDQDRCVGCRYCEMACPYGAPQYSPTKKVMTKCDGCFERISPNGKTGRKPICVEACPMRALDFDEIGILREKYGQQADTAPLPSSEKTKPSLVIRSNRYARPAGDTTGNLQNPQEV